jgi:hypothetical protein
MSVPPAGSRGFRYKGARKTTKIIKSICHTPRSIGVFFITMKAVNVLMENFGKTFAGSLRDCGGNTGFFPKSL